MARRFSTDPVAIARAVKAAVEAVPDVASVSSGRFARIGTYGPNTVVRGVAVSNARDGVAFDVHIVASSKTESLPALAEMVRHITRETALKHGADAVVTIDVTIEDLSDEGSL